MLVSLTRVGATKQGIEKAFTVLGADPATMARAFESVSLDVRGTPLGVVPVSGSPGLFTLRVPPVWLGTRRGRDEVFSGLAAALAELCRVTARTGGVLVPPGVAVGDHRAVFGGDVHMIEVLSPVEQEVLCNLLRGWVPALIAVAGHGLTSVGRSPDRTGSRWLATSNSHLATRFLASTTPEHLERVKAELRRRDGVARLDRMDVAPGVRADGTPVVLVRCLDAAATLAGTRAAALLLSALALHARRLVRDGRRTGHAPQRMLEENRARAIADGLRARFAVEDSRATGRRNRHRRAARDAVRDLLREVVVEFGNLETDVAEIAPLLMGVDLPGLGVRAEISERGLLARWAVSGEETLVSECRRALGDATPGGPLLAHLNAEVPGRTSVVLGSWRERIEGPAKPLRRSRQEAR
ncbi:hypothetical protein [Amycolatopsis rifamycinica]|nr:hypothetical protein [Amycolatopsis rifamycinica]